MSANSFAYIYAIQMPNGDLFTVPEHSGMFGFFTTTSENQRLVTWDTQEEAEHALTNLKTQAAQLGMLHWAGTIVRALRSPFATTDPEQVFRDQVLDWARQNGGTP